MDKLRIDNGELRITDIGAEPSHFELNPASRSSNRETVSVAGFDLKGRSWPVLLTARRTPRAFSFLKKREGGKEELKIENGWRVSTPYSRLISVNQFNQRHRRSISFLKQRNRGTEE